MIGSGALIRTGDVDTFKEHINSLSASVGGNFSDMFLSGLLVCFLDRDLNVHSA